jgi:TRAP transporter TAXI family solute receptor
MRTPKVRTLSTAILTLLLTIGSAAAQKLPASTAIGTNPAGTAFYAVGAGLAKMISTAGSMQSTVQPYTGSSTFLPLLDSGEIDFGIVNAVEMNLGFQGPARLKISGKNPLPHVPNTRLIMRGSPLSVSLVVRKDAPMKTIHDVKGMRVTGEYPANIAIWFHVYTELANAGMTWNDVKVVPVPAVNDGVDALVQGRADAANHAIGVAKVSNDLVTYSLKAIWDNIEKLPPLNPQFQEWTRARAVSSDVTIPYHPAAVQFFKEKNLWNPKMEETQKGLLAMNP